jgi:hypothetical protein
MFQKVLNFVKYNNAFTIAVMLVFFGAGISFAASPELRDTVYASSETVISVDNTLIVSSDLDSFNFNLKINSITDDDKNYYATYSYQTLVITNGVWQSQEMDKVLTVNKEALNGKDLGLYVAKELGDNMNYELSYLKRVQELEKEKGQSQKVVSVEYSGLIGKLLDPKEKVIEGYTPVIPEPAPQVAATVESNPQEVIVSIPPTPAPAPIQEATTTPDSSTPTPIVDTGLVQKVVEVELLQSESTSTSTSTATTTPNDF